MNNKIKIMGILNVTPDSFSDGGEFFDVESAVTHAKEMLSSGADIIDIGGESTRPGSEPVPEKEEIKRVIPVIKKLKNDLGENIIISIDTWKASVAKEAIQHGAAMVNSLGGFQFDEALAPLVAKENVHLVIYHTSDRPKTMQQNLDTRKVIMTDIANFFETQIAFGQKHGIAKEQFILDPGIGFGKTLEQNITIIKQLSSFKEFGLPILIGISRKSHLNLLLQELLQTTTIFSPNERLEASLAETAIAVQNGATIVRTHDVAETKKFVSVLETFLNP